MTFDKKRLLRVTQDIKTNERVSYAQAAPTIEVLTALLEEVAALRAFIEAPRDCTRCSGTGSVKSSIMGLTLECQPCKGTGKVKL